MSTVQKFTFDLDFDAPEEPEEAEIEEVEEEPEEEIPTFSEEELEQARAEGFEAGKEEGRREAADATEQKLLEAIEKACAELSEIYNTQTAANREIGREMVSVSTAIAKKMFPDLNARNALGEVERVVQETLKAVTEEPRIQIMVNPELREPLTERLGTMTHRAGFEGKVFVNPDPSMALGDCRIEWSNGAAVRDGEELWEMIEEIIEHNLHGPADFDEEADESPSAEDTQSPPEARAPETNVPEPEKTADAESASEQAAMSEDNAAQPENTVPEDVDNADSQRRVAPEDSMNTETEADSISDTVDMEDATVEETPSWEAQTSESVEADPVPAPDPAPEATPQPADMEAEDAGDDVPLSTKPGAHGPSFAPTLDAAEDFAPEENIQENQSITDSTDDAPIPHLDDAAPADATDTDADGDDTPPIPTVTDPDPVSPATQAAILDAQSAMDDDERDPSGG